MAFSPDELNKLKFNAESFYQRAFSRNCGLISEDEQLKLNNTRVAIPSIGGMGSIHATTLARTGIGRFTIADFDQFDVHNINRQHGTLVSTVGQDKVLVMESMIKDINPSVAIKVINKAIDITNVDDFLADADVMIDALDVFVINARRLLYRRARKLGIPVISAGPIGFSGVVNVFAPDGMSFDDFFGLNDSMSEKQMLLTFFASVPFEPHLRYIPVIIGYAVFIVYIMAVLARHIINVIVSLLLNNITRLAPSVCALEICRFNDNGYMTVKGVDPATGAAPSLGLACQIGAGMAATDVIRYVLDRPKIKAVP